jgi:hypothetical protein
MAATSGARARDAGARAATRFAGVAQSSQVGLKVLLEFSIRGLKLAQILGQPCEFYLRPRRAA